MLKTVYWKDNAIIVQMPQHGQFTCYKKLIVQTDSRPQSTYVKFTETCRPTLHIRVRAPQGVVSTPSLFFAQQHIETCTSLSSSRSSRYHNRLLL